MKVSILSLPKEINYGAVLQCYALCRILQDMGHTIDIIDLQLRKRPMKWYSFIIRIPMLFGFYRFRRQYLDFFTRRFNCMSDLRHHCPQSDLYIVGSDQVWNPDITNRTDSLFFFFSFLPEGARRISYAASFGTNIWQYPELTNEVKLLLSKFEAVSVREESGVEICKNIFNINASMELDPALLLSSYDDICGEYNPAHVTNDLIYYKFVHSETAQNIISHFVKSQNIRAVNLGGFHSIQGFKSKKCFSISEWLNAIRYSQIVVTDSFHCMVFCILFHKRFVVLPAKSNRSTRQKSLLKQLDLSEHYCEKIKDLNIYLCNAFNTKTDYSEIDKRINILREESISYLRSHCQK